MKIDLAITNAFQEKNNLTGKKSAYAFKFNNVSYNPEQIIDWVTSGKSISVARVHNKHRDKDEFISSQLIGIDIDGGNISSVEALLQIPFIHENAFFVGPTASSRPDAPRSRILFILDEAITDPQLYSIYVTRIMAHLEEQGVEPDEQCKDCTRLFHGSTVDGYWSEPGNILNLETIQKLPPVQPKQTKQSSPKRHASIVRKPLNKKELKGLKKKIRAALSYIPKQPGYGVWLRILMAVFNALPNQGGIDLIEDWSPGYPGEVEEKFNSFASERADKITINTLWHIARQHGWPDDSSLIPDKIVNERYISDVEIDYSGAWVIRSDMATGKSELVAKAIGKMQEDNPASRVLLVSHRVALINNLAERYQDLHFEVYSELNTEDMSRPANLICTPNSLYKLLDENGKLPHYDLIVFDEVKQILAHLTGDTFEGSQGVNANNIMRNLIARATCVLGLDAHAADLSYTYFKAIRDDVRYLVNTFKVDRGRMAFMEEEDWLSLLLHSVEHQVDPIVVACDQKREVEKLKAYFETKGIYNVMAVHSDNSDTPAVRYFLDHIDEELPKYKSLIFSPTIGTGVDIQAPVEAVFGYFGCTSITAEEQHQMLGRCRNAGEFYIHFKPVKHNKETNARAIYDRYFSNLLKTGQLADFDAEGNLELTEGQKRYLGLYSRIEAARNHDMNRIEKQFKQLAEQNFKVCEDSFRDTGALEEYHELAERQKERLKELTLTQTAICPEQYEQLLRTQELTLEIQAGYIRWQIEDFYGQKISPELRDLWEDGGKAKLSQFIDLYQPQKTMHERDRQEESEQFAWSNRRHWAQRWDALQALLSAIFGDDLHGNPLSEEEFFTRLNGPFVEAVKLHQQAIYKVFNRRIAKGKEDEPLSILRYALKQIGLKLTVNRHGKDKSKRTYTLDEELLSLMRSLATYRAEAKHIQINLDKEVFKT